ncbi:MAG TPA: GspE/PulE family protein, partial [Actinomycetota bacterium]|nr:GspE/PulE family protein [Actinomycetota bacterium]
DPEAAALVPHSVCTRHAVLALGFREGKLVVAMADPGNLLVLDDLRIRTGHELDVLVATREDILAAIERLRSMEDTTDLLAEPEAEPDGPVGLEAVDAADRAPIVKAVNRIIMQAVEQRASDIHVEPEERDVRIRFRIDGVLHEKMRLQKAHQHGIVSRLKVMGEADIAEKRLPQDGRVTVSVAGSPIDLRISTLPSAHGEEVVIRILDRSSSLLGLEDMGFTPAILDRYRTATAKTTGAILVTGPTGSGKSTTLYATLNELNDPSRKIITVEDPIEYRIGGLRQMQVHPAIGLTFAHALRSILRSDPDVIMVGEIRDRDTASMGVHAAMTGHLVLATLHTNDAPTAPTRLTEMGVEPFLVASAVQAVVAQRLARRLCPECAEPYEPTQELLERIGVPVPEGKSKRQLKRPVGCRHCANTGYRGRVALAELMLVTDEIERAVADRAPTETLAEIARSQGMVPLLEDGLAKAAAGITSLEEVLRVVG